MSYIADQHSHCIFSCDSDSPIRDMCEAAIANGLSELSVTDHFDINTNPMLRTLEPPYDHDSAYEALCRARDEYHGRLKLTVGIELGQIHNDPDEARYLLHRHDFDQVIGSLHSLRGMPDFYLMAFYKITHSQCDLFLTQYFKELEEIVDIGCFDTLAHLTYPLRYFKEGGHNMRIEHHIPAIKRIYSKIIDKGIALEVNTSGYRKDLLAPLPDYSLIQLYYDMGGRYITCGADAHCVEDIGADIERTYNELKNIGFTHICSFTERKMELKEI